MRWIFLALLIMNLGYFGYSNFLRQPVYSDADPAVLNTAAQGGKPLVLLAEMAEEPAPRVNDEPQQPGVCWLAGPFSDADLAKNIRARMLALDIPVTEKSTRRLIKTEYWVYLPPLPNREKAMRKLRELQKRDIDSFVVTDGELENAISLGLFSKEESVQAVVKSLKNKGYQAETKTLERTRETYWVMASHEANAQLVDKTREHIAGNENVKWQQVRCEDNLPEQ